MISLVSIFKAKQKEEFDKTTLPKHLEMLENLVKETGQNGFAVGQSVSFSEVL
jgi:hypothetical protein